MIFDSITLLIFFCASLLLFGKNFLKMKRISTCNSFCVLFFITLVLLAGSIWAFTQDYLPFHKFELYTKLAFSFLNGIVLLLFCLLAFEKLDRKKRKVLWRIPLITLLLVMLKPEFSFYVDLLVAALILFIWFKKRVKLRILTMNIAIHLVLILSSFFFQVQNLWLFNIVMLIYIINLNSWWDMARIKSLIPIKDS